MTARRYSVVGLGKLGACMAAAIASRGHEVVGVDANPVVLATLAGGRAPVAEPGLQELLDLVGERLTTSRSCAEAVGETDVTFVVVPTPSEPGGAYSLEHASSALADVGRGIARKGAYHLVVLTSTVLPGDCRERLVPVLEAASGLRAGDDFGFCYSPEFIALGSVVRDFLNPDFLLIGAHDELAGRLLESSYAEIVANDAPCESMSLENAELAKVALNSFVTTKIAFANTLAAICERLPGGDVDAVTQAIGRDRRIGSAYLRGGLGFGGPCFPRDNRAFAQAAQAVGVTAEIAEATDRANGRVPERIVAQLRPFVATGTRVAVLGLSYKPGSDVLEASQSLAVARSLSELGAAVSAFDPLVDGRAPELAGTGVRVAPTLDDCLVDAEVVVMATPDGALSRALPTALGSASPGAIVLDCWRLVTDEAIGAAYCAVGRATSLPDVRPLEEVAEAGL